MKFVRAGRARWSLSEQGEHVGVCQSRESTLEFVRTGRARWSLSEQGDHVED